MFQNMVCHSRKVDNTVSLWLGSSQKQGGIFKSLSNFLWSFSDRWKMKLWVLSRLWKELHLIWGQLPWPVWLACVPQHSKSISSASSFLMNLIISSFSAAPLFIHSSQNPLVTCSIYLMSEILHAHLQHRPLSALAPFHPCVTEQSMSLLVLLFWCVFVQDIKQRIKWHGTWKS